MIRLLVESVTTTYHEHTLDFALMVVVGQASTLPHRAHVSFSYPNYGAPPPYRVGDIVEFSMGGAK